MASFTNVPIDYDYKWIAKQANANIMGVETTLTHNIVSYAIDPGVFTAFTNIVENYETEYLAKAIPVKRAQVIALRKEKIKNFTFGLDVIQLDSDTENRITSATLFLQRNADVASINWDLGSGKFKLMTREVVFQLCDAAGKYVQNCFNYSKTLVDAIKASTTLTQLKLINIENGWPTNA